MRQKIADILVILFYLMITLVGVCLLIDPSPSMGSLTDASLVDEELRAHGILLALGSLLGIVARLLGKGHVESVSRFTLAGACLLRVITDASAYGFGYWNLYWFSAAIFLTGTGITLPDKSVKSLLAHVKGGG